MAFISKVDGGIYGTHSSSRYGMTEGETTCSGEVSKRWGKVVR